MPHLPPATSVQAGNDSLIPGDLAIASHLVDVKSQSTPTPTPSWGFTLLAGGPSLRRALLIMDVGVGPAAYP